MRSSLLFLACGTSSALLAPRRHNVGPRLAAALAAGDCAVVYDVWTHADTEFDPPPTAAAAPPGRRRRVPAALDLARAALRTPLLLVAIAARVHSLLTADECDVQPKRARPEALPAGEMLIEMLRVVALLVAMPVWIAFDTTPPFIRARAAAAPTCDHPLYCLAAS
ncbi:hypothetical protein M885DRAFT_514626 [Pelagophyceae sp. CCMP2097]|nr:hypothetical protein M885DRAFT_514626 [Pelagophyceae sp. CCMP2097]